MHVGAAMRKLWLMAVLIVLAVAPQRAFAADTQPGDACSTANQVTMNGGAEDSGTRDFMICNGSTWQSLTRFAASGNVGIGNTAPGSLLDIGKAGTTLGTLRLEGSTSGYTQIQPATAAGSWTATLPGSAGINGYVLTTDGSGNLSWTNAGAATTPLSGILASTASTTIANTNYPQIWNWNTLTTGKALTLATTSLTTGNLLALTDSNGSASGGTVLKVTSADSGNGAVGIYTEVSGASGTMYALRAVASGGSSSGQALVGVISGGSNNAAVEGDTLGSTGVYGLVVTAAINNSIGVYGQTDSSGTGSAGVYGISTSVTATLSSSVDGNNASPSGYGGYFTNTNGGIALGTGSGKIKLGAAGTSFTAMGACTVASYTPTSTTTNVTCTGVPASASVAVTCSESAAFTTPNTTVIYARATGTLNQIAVNLNVANSVAVTLTCMWVQP